MIHEKLLIMVSGTLQRLSKHQDQYQYSLLPAQPEEHGQKGAAEGESSLSKSERAACPRPCESLSLKPQTVKSDSKSVDNQASFTHIP